LRRGASVLAAVALLTGAALLRPGGARACPIEDSFADFLSLAERAHGSPEAGLAAFHADFLPRTAGLYTAEVIGVVPGEKLDDRVRGALAAAGSHPQWAAYDARLRRDIPMAEAKFRAAFPDFRCNFAIYLAPTFGQMDGGGRIVAGRPALVFGVDTVAGFETPEQLPVLFAHELFHRYHAQAAGFGDDDNADAPVWRTLWTEGLATYVSATLNPDRPLADALLLPRDLEAQPRPILPRLAAELAARLDAVDPAFTGEYFQYHDATATARGVPWRAGYYVGYLVARDLGRSRSLNELAHLQGEPLRRAIGESLARLEAGPPPTRDIR
jgi:hypothetical protein